MRALALPFVFFLSSASSLLAQDRIFTIPLSDLTQWSHKVTVSMNVEITGNSKVHELKNDCELHFGAKAPSFDGEPAGVVLEPMNVCLEPFPGKPTQSNKDWENFAKGLKGAKVRVEGVPRIWPEHLDGEESPSNPNHALELHPLTRLQRGNNIQEFAQFIYAPEGYEGGVSASTANKIVTDTEVAVTEKDGVVEVEFDSGRIGNFTILQVAFKKNAIRQLEGGHRIKGEVVIDRSQRVPVTLLTVAGSGIDSAVSRMKSGKRSRFTFEALVLFSLCPEALHKAASESNGKRTIVHDPLQLILYGVPDTREE